MGKRWTSCYNNDDNDNDNDNNNSNDNENDNDNGNDNDNDNDSDNEAFNVCKPVRRRGYYLLHDIHTVGRAALCVVG